MADLSRAAAGGGHQLEDLLDARWGLRRQCPAVLQGVSGKRPAGSERVLAAVPGRLQGRLRGRHAATGVVGALLASRQRAPAGTRYLWRGGSVGSARCADLEHVAVVQVGAVLHL